MTVFSPVIEPCDAADQIDRFLADVEAHPDTEEILIRRTGYIAEVVARGGTDVKQWSNLRHAGHAYTQKLRSQLHEQIREELLKPDAKMARGTKPIATIVIGPPAAGKTSTAVPYVMKKFGVHYSSINPDDVKIKLPEYEGWNADALHEESSDVAEKNIETHAVNRRHNIILDIVGRTREKVERSIGEFHDLGYSVYVVLADIPSWKAANRAWNRFQKNPLWRDRTLDPGRFVPPHFVQNVVGSTPIATFAIVKHDRRISGFCHMNVDVPEGELPIIVEERM
jgi:hypothetical protein